MLQHRAFFLFTLSIAAGAGLLHCASDDDPSAGGGIGAATDGGSSTTNGNDGGSSSTDGAPQEDADRPPRCDPKKPFGAPTTVLENSFLIDQSARLSPDELTLYYASYGQGGVNGQTDIGTATRTSTTAPFTNPTKVTELATADDNELYPTVTADGLTVYYDGHLADAGYGVLKATRANASEPWGAPTMLTGLDLSMVYVAPDGTRLYGVKDLPGGPPYAAELHYVDLPYDGGASQVIPGTATGSLQYWPVVSADGLTLFYSYPMNSPYRWELGVATRASTSVPFGPATKVTELDTDGGADEDPTWVSPDGCTLYFRRVNGDIPGNASGLLQVSRGL